MSGDGQPESTAVPNHWQLKRVFVTGATGLLGSWLVKSLVDLDAEVVCLVRDEVPRSLFHSLELEKSAVTVRGQVEDLRVVERVLNEYEVEVVFHLAAQTIVGTADRSPLSSFESNIKGTWSLLEACRISQGIRGVVVASSDKAYGEHDSLPYTEDMELRARNPYDVSKAATDLLAQSYQHSYGMPIAITRCGNLYGGGDLNFSRLIPGTIRSVLLGERPVIRSDGTYVRDYFYVEDAASACLRLAQCLESDPEHAASPFNFSSEDPVDALGMTRRVLGVMKSDLEPIILNTAQNEIPRQYLSSEKARRQLGWSQTIDPNDALARTVEWYRSYFRGVTD
jgi:CDP-glucose 4,6-dehydratase